MSVLKSIRRKRPIVAPLAGTIPTVGFISASGDFQHGQPWCLLSTDALSRSSDGGRTLYDVLDERGRAQRRNRN
jgi:hypothetical protein